MYFDRVGLEIGGFMSYLSKRQEVISSNIANADTPGYKTRDVEMPVTFFGAFQAAEGNLVDTTGLQSRNDGNNVSIDREARLLAETALKFNVAAQMARGEIKGIRAAIEEGRAA